MEHRTAEIATGRTLVGPHKDEIRVLGQLSGARELVDLAAYGSRGQQRLAVLWLKLAELHYLEEMTGQKAILLLDDIFSELDEAASQLVMAMLGDRQTFVTTASENVVQLETCQTIRL